MGILSIPECPGANDQRHRFVLTGIWELNYANHLPRTAKPILSGWELSGILRAQTGQPYSGLVNFDLNNDGNAATDRTPGFGRDTFCLPAAISVDPRVTRNVQLTERAKLQFLWEAFNVFNHSNITSVRATQFSRSTVSGPVALPARRVWFPSAPSAGLPSLSTTAPAPSRSKHSAR